MSMSERTRTYAAELDALADELEVRAKAIEDAAALAREPLVRAAGDHAE